MQKLHFIELDSTNDYLKNNYESLNNLTFVSADYQIKGRGRNERKWFSSKGENLLFSILIKENITLKEPGLYSIYCIVEIAKYLEKIGLKNVLIKWPNDIYVNDKKILGVLSEGKYLGSNLLYVIVGIGLNVNQQYLNEQLSPKLLHFDSILFLLIPLKLGTTTALPLDIVSFTTSFSDITSSSV